MKWLKTRPAKTRLWQISLLGLATLTVLSIGLLTSAGADTIVRGFNSKQAIQPGWVVAFSKGTKDTVEAAPARDPSLIYGVVIDPAQAPVTLQAHQGQKVFVATSGTYPVLVNTENGSISPGDYISLSSTNGIGAKATTQHPYILGQALEKFDGNSGVITGGQGSAAIGRVGVTIMPSRNPLVKSDLAVPSVLRRAGEAIAGKNVSALRIYAALVIFVITALICGSLLWAGVRNGMIAIGRNPLSRHSIVEGLVQVTLVSVAVFIVGLFAVYLLLKL